jgi:hypothetical protein
VPLILAASIKILVGVIRTALSVIALSHVD